MRPLSLISSLAFLSLLLVGCNRTSHEETVASPPPELLGDDVQAPSDMPSTENGISIKDAGNAGLMLVLARDACQISKADFDHLAQYLSATIGEDEQLKSAFVGGAKAAVTIHQDAVNKGSLEKLKSLTCPGVEKMLAALPDAKQG
jgi:hypothetical protein